ncbi:MAG: hypothetical protein H0T79_21285 [Deltaproteobacteria bacterium]|nr:hypothetical protein [Deltaproteobacteria bacterium]
MQLGKLTSLDAPEGVKDLNDCCEFQGKYYWSAYGDRGGVYDQKGSKLASVFDDADCWSLTTTDTFLFAASADGVTRFDGKRWLALHVKYDSRNEVWSAVPARKRKAK